FDFNANTVSILQVDDTHVSFRASNNQSIKTVTIYDLLGRQLYQLKGQNSEETYNLSKLKNAIFIAKIELSNGAFITKKAIKK
ncbi:T9SS type A sorting domain-containing protein, partial [Yeosuana sp.]|uniref:T9SS type A sorting domain-containing protein n=1 Tax=Yeosuana sp. TaxID=2529388 RepID=UPI004054E4B7